MTALRNGGGADPVTRRGALRRVLLAGPALLGASACTRRGSDRRVASSDDPIASPSGDFTAQVMTATADDGSAVLHPTISDVDGTVVWTDDLDHVERFAPGLVWESEADVLWVLSSDHGTASVRRSGDGAWVKTMGTDGMPEDVAELAG
ncbi:hypothetical protein ACXET9_09555 [Brachybacterium sp. DNPG3]